MKRYRGILLAVPSLLLFAFATTELAAAAATPAVPGAAQSGQQKPRKKVKAVVQARPGGPLEEIEMEVHAAPVDPTTVDADKVDLEDDELVLGLIVDGRPIAYPVRYLALSEVLNDTVGDTPITPTW